MPSKSIKLGKTLLDFFSSLHLTYPKSIKDKLFKQPICEKNHDPRNSRLSKSHLSHMPLPS